MKIGTTLSIGRITCGTVPVKVSNKPILLLKMRGRTASSTM
jgi:hypothetical protein